jgi:hypothetical protein
MDVARIHILVVDDLVATRSTPQPNCCPLGGTTRLPAPQGNQTSNPPTSIGPMRCSWSSQCLPWMDFCSLACSMNCPSAALARPQNAFKKT